MQLNLTPRLLSIIKHVRCETAADIGTDHAYVPIALLLKKRARRIIASDLNPGPAAIAEQNIEKYGLSQSARIRIGEGLDVLRCGEADTIIIAGMGGEMIEKIIRENEKTARAARLVLQPMNNQYELRRFLTENGFSIEEEDISVEGFKVYNLFVVRNGTCAPFEKDIHYHIPPYLISHPLFGALYDKKLREFTRVISGLERSAAPDEEKLEKYRAWKRNLEEEFSKKGEGK